MRLVDAEGTESMKKPLMLTRYEVSCLRRAIADWTLPLSPSEKAARTRLYTALYELGEAMDADWRKPRIRL